MVVIFIITCYILRTVITIKNMFQGNSVSKDFKGAKLRICLKVSIYFGSNILSSMLTVKFIQEVVYRFLYSFIGVPTISCSIFK